MKLSLPFVPILVGATLRDRLLPCVGAVIGITLTSLVSAVALHGWIPLPLLVTPIGASAVFVFAVPASPLAQPWSVVGGNVVSALVGIAAARFVPSPYMAVGVAQWRHDDRRRSELRFLRPASSARRTFHHRHAFRRKPNQRDRCTPSALSTMRSSNVTGRKWAPGLRITAMRRSDDLIWPTSRNTGSNSSDHRS